MKAAPVQWTDSRIEAPPELVGPQLPVARCRDCNARLKFERVRWGRNGYGWRCWCEGCVDGEYAGDPATLQMSVRAGEGEGPWQALDDCAAMQWDCYPEELLEGV